MPEAHDQRPYVWDDEAICGDTYRSPVFQLVDSTGAPYSLAGVTAETAVLAGLGKRVVLEPDFVVVDEAAGKWRLEATAAATLAIAPGPYIYGVRLTWTDTSKRTTVRGNLQFLPRVVP